MTRDGALLSTSFLALFVGGTLLIGVAGSFATASSIPTWYADLHRPSFAPPNWVFRPAWTLLYVMIGVAGWRIWLSPKSENRRRALDLWIVQLFFNLAWSFIFFYLQQIGLALIEILVLLGLIGAAISKFRRIDPAAAWLMVPYCAWVAFAAILNFGFWWGN